MQLEYRIRWATAALVLATLIVTFHPAASREVAVVRSAASLNVCGDTPAQDSQNRDNSATNVASKKEAATQIASPLEVLTDFSFVTERAGFSERLS